MVGTCQPGLNDVLLNSIEKNKIVFDIRYTCPPAFKTLGYSVVEEKLYTQVDFLQLKFTINSANS